MAWAFTCECGNRLSGETEAELTEMTRTHVAAQHPAVALPSPADVLAMAEEVAVPAAGVQTEERVQ